MDLHGTMRKGQQDQRCFRGCLCEKMNRGPDASVLLKSWPREGPPATSTQPRRMGARNRHRINLQRNEVVISAHLTLKTFNSLRATLLHFKELGLPQLYWFTLIKSWRDASADHKPSDIPRSLNLSCINPIQYSNLENLFMFNDNER